MRTRSFLLLGLLATVVPFAVLIGVRLREPEKAVSETAAPPTPGEMEERALALQESGNYSAAEELFRRSLSERQKALGPDHIDTLACMNNLANLLHVRNNDTEAGFLHQQCLEAASGLSARIIRMLSQVSIICPSSSLRKEISPLRSRWRGEPGK
jgi:hypothetical protein